LEAKYHKTKEEQKMSDVMKRTVFIEHEEGKVVRFHDWALVITELGSMLEPFQQIGSKYAPDTKAGLVNFDATDAGCRIDEIKHYSLDKGLMITGDSVIGGNLMPRSGR